VPVYEEATKKLPPPNIPLETKDATYYFFSADPLKGELTYSTDQRHPANLETITPVRAKDIIEMNRRGQKPVNLGGKQSNVAIVEVDYQNVVGQDDLTRFDKKKNKNNNHNSNQNRRHNGRKNNEKNTPRNS
jgi:hypothetical protein